MNVTEPVLWARGTINEVWDVEASAAVDIITGASPRLVSNANGDPVQTLTGASINDRLNTPIKVARHIGDWTLAASRAVSDEEDYNSKAFGLEARMDLNEKNTTPSRAMESPTIAWARRTIRTFMSRDTRRSTWSASRSSSRPWISSRPR